MQHRMQHKHIAIKISNPHTFICAGEAPLAPKKVRGNKFKTPEFLAAKHQQALPRQQQQQQQQAADLQQQQQPQEQGASHQEELQGGAAAYDAVPGGQQAGAQPPGGAGTKGKGGKKGEAKAEAGKQPQERIHIRNAFDKPAPKKTLKEKKKQ